MTKKMYIFILSALFSALPALADPPKMESFEHLYTHFWPYSQIENVRIPVEERSREALAFLYYGKQYEIFKDEGQEDLPISAVNYADSATLFYQAGEYLRAGKALLWLARSLHNKTRRFYASYPRPPAAVSQSWADIVRASTQMHDYEKKKDRFFIVAQSALEDAIKLFEFIGDLHSMKNAEASLEILLADKSADEVYRRLSPKLKAPTLGSLSAATFAEAVLKGRLPSRYFDHSPAS